MQNNTIVAQATPIGTGAIALIRVSGPETFKIVDSIARCSAPSLSARPSHTIVYGSIISDNHQILDHVLFFLMRGPKSFTGEDIIEITCHNNQQIVHAIINRCIQAGARLAERGEFTRRAVENNKMDLLEAEAINDLISAQTSHELQCALAQLDGSFSAWINKLHEELIKAQALCEISFEFLEQEYDPRDELIAICSQIQTKLKTAQTQFSAQQQIRSGLRIALIGSSNAGKSSLLNVLSNQNRAIVTPIPGTTRDTIEATIQTDTIAWTLVDTAGFRETDDIIEQAGIERTKQEIIRADLLLLLIDGHVKEIDPITTAEYKRLQEQYGQKIIIVQTKYDSITETNPYAKPDLYISNTTGAGIAELKNLINSKTAQLLKATELPFSLNQRHMHAIVRAQTVLQEIEHDLLSPEPAYELLSIQLGLIISELNKLSGREQHEELLNQVFSSFCVGK